MQKNIDNMENEEKETDLENLYCLSFRLMLFLEMMLLYLLNLCLSLDYLFTEQLSLQNE